MASDILRRITGIEIFPVVSLVIFVAVFAGVLLWAVRADKRRLAELAALPLADAGAAPDAAGDPEERSGRDQTSR